MEEKNKQDLSEQSKRLKEIARQLELFRDDLNGYGQFVDRNIKQGNELVNVEKKIKAFLDIYEKFKVSDTLCIERSKVKSFLIAMEKYYLKLKTEAPNSSQA